MSARYDYKRADSDSPFGLAFRMASYVKDPAYIVGYVAREYGKHRAPSLKQVQQMRDQHEGSRTRKKALVEKRDAGIECEAANDDEIVLPKPTQVVPIVHQPKAERVEIKRMWPTWYKPARKPVFASEIIQGVADDFEISFGELIGSDRRVVFVNARAVVAKVLRSRGWSFPKIGNAIGKRDHSTVINLTDNFEIYARRDERVLWSYNRWKVA